MSDPQSALCALAVHYWKLCAAFERELAFAPADRVAGGEAQLRFAQRKLDTILDDAQLRLVTYDGQPWTPDLPASPVNGEDIAAGAGAAVDSTLEPTIVGEGRVLHPGKILLREV